MSKKTLLVIVVIGFVFSLLSGCKKGTPTTCKGWANLLTKPTKTKDAIKNLGDLGNKCKEFIPDLEKIFPTSTYKQEIIQTIKAINAPKESVSILKIALQDPDAAVVAAAVAEDFALAELRPDLIQILEGNKAIKARENALRALARIDKDNIAKHEDLLIQLLRNDPNVQDIKVNALAADYLGEIRSMKAIPHLIVGMFMRTQRGLQMYTPCRKALVKIGPPAVDPLIGVLTNDQTKYGDLLKDLEETAKKSGVFPWQWQEGPEIIQVLSDIRDPKAAVAIAKSLAKPLNPPVGVDDRVMRSWQATQLNRITMSMIAMWNMGNQDVVPILKDIITNSDADAKQRLDTGTSLALLPKFIGLDALISVYPKVSEQELRAPLLKPLALGMDWKHYNDFVKMVKADKSELVKQRFEGNDVDAQEIKSLLSVLKDCKEGDIDCLISKLNGDDVIAGGKAALLLAEFGEKDKNRVIEALANRYPQTDPASMVDLRRFILLAMWRLGDKSTIPHLERMMKSDMERKGAGYWIEEIETFIPTIARK